MQSRPSDPVATLTVVGDVHRWWRPADAAFLERTRPDLSLFVGDLGDEDVPIVRAIASLPVPKAVILGNHDAWQSFGRDAPLAEALADLEHCMLNMDHIHHMARMVLMAHHRSGY